MDKQQKILAKHRNRERFWHTFSDLREDPVVMSLQQYPNHRISNLYDHSSRVALCAYDLARRFRWEIDGDALAKGAMLHDLYFYHAAGRSGKAYREHLFGHPAVALENAREHFELSPKEENIITSHMWPMTPLHVPRSKEAFLVQLADKVCAFGEGVLRRNQVRQERYQKKAQACSDAELQKLIRLEIKEEKRAERRAQRQMGRQGQIQIEAQGENIARGNRLRWQRKNNGSRSKKGYIVLPR